MNTDFMSVKKQETPSSILKTLVFQLEKLNVEQGNICGRLFTLNENLSKTEPSNQKPSPHQPEIEPERLTSGGDGLLPSFERMVIRYQDMITTQNAVITKLETFI